MDPETRLKLLDQGASPALIAKLGSGYAVMGDNQYLPGYCLLLATPMVSQLNDLSGDQRSRFLGDMTCLGDALIAATGCKRVNYGIYGNLDPFLHVHVWPRYEWEEEEYSKIPPFLFPLEFRNKPENDFSAEAHGGLLSKIRRFLVAGKL